MKVAGKVIVVTGAGGGIGGELVMKLLAQGAKVAAVDVKDDGLLQIQKRSSSVSSELSLHVLDITDRTAVEELPQVVIQSHGCVDGLINCAGIIQPFVTIGNLDYSTIERVMNINYYGTLHMVKSFLPHLLHRPVAHIVNVSSMGGFLPVPGQGIYGASKAAVKLMTEALYAELLETPVRVSAVYPGATNTNITQNSHVDIPHLGEKAKEMQRRSLPADRAAALIIKGMERDKFQILTGKDAVFMNRLYRINPRYATRFIAKQMRSLLNP